MMFQLCGLNESKDDQNKTTNEVYDREHLKQSAKEKIICDVNAVVVMSITGFLWAFFNQYK